MTFRLNDRAFELLSAIRIQSELLRIDSHMVEGGGGLLDFGVNAEGGLQAGLALARVCLSGLGSVDLVPGDIGGLAWPLVQVVTDHPTAACLLSQYAGWQLASGKFFAMGSGPMRAAAAREELFSKLDYRETVSFVVGILEGRQFPPATVFQEIAARTGTSSAGVTLAVAPTASPAGTVQVVARSVETALHKLHELGFEVSRIRSACGTAPLAPVARDDLTGIGWTNDAILYGGQVRLWVRGDDESLAEIGPRVPANSSASFGRPFLSIFEAAGRDFYKIDPHLFSPAEVVFHNLDTGRTHRFGGIAPDVLKKSYGV